MCAQRSLDDEDADGWPQRPAEETARLGDAIYEGVIRAQVEGEHHGEVVAIDVDSGDYEVDADALIAARGLRVRRPHADVWFVRVGFRALDRIGAGAEWGER